MIFNKWTILFAGVIIQTILGGIYAWSVFTPALKEAHNISTGQSAMVFGMTIAVFTLSMVVSGRILESKGPRFTAAIGALLFAAGYIIASFSGGRYPIILFAIGGISGAGIGFCYVCPLSVGIKWFPKHKGLISGIAVAGFGAGACFLSKFALLMLNSGVDVLLVFRYIGLFLGLTVLFASFMLSDPPPHTQKRHEENISKRSIPLLQLLMSTRFKLLFLGIFAGTFGGLLVIGNLKPIGSIGGISEIWATIAITVFAIGNAIGRISWGGIHDSIGRTSIPLSLLVLTTGISLLIFSDSTAVFLLSSALTGFGFGGCFVIYAASVAEEYGVEQFARIYPLIFLGYGIAGFTGPAIGGWLAEVFSSYTPAIALGAIVPLLTVPFFFTNFRTCQKS
jgi:OFA family oxalate/formate antiporter-like MFS transporter